jgi:hypothetical protein
MLLSKMRTNLVTSPVAGSSPTCHRVLAEPRVSQQHAAVKSAPETHYYFLDSVEFGFDSGLRRMD